MALLNFTDTRANTLMGAGNKTITNDQIKQFITTPGMTNEKIMNEALKQGISIGQIESAMGGQNGFNADSMKQYTQDRGVTYNPKPAGNVPVPGSFVDTRAGILNSGGNQSLSNKQIQDFVKTPGMTPERIMNEALKQGVSINQLSSAMQGSGTPGDWSVNNLTRYAQERGVNFGTVQDADPEMAKTLNGVPQASSTQAPFTRANFDEKKGTVAGRLESVLDPNSPLMQRAQMFANQQMNRRGLLNSDMATSASQAAMVDAGLQIATPDANSFNQFELTNANNQNQNSMFNAGETNKVGMFNAGNMTDVMKTKMGIDNDRFLDSQNTLRTQMGINRDFDLAKLDTDTQMNIQNAKSREKAASDYAALTDTLMKASLDVESLDIPPEEKARRLQQLDDIMNRAMALNSFIDGVDLDLDFGATPSPQSASQGSNSTVAQGSVQEVQQKQTEGQRVTNRFGYDLDPTTMNLAKSAEEQYGIKIDPSKIVSKQELDEIYKSQNTLGAIGIERKIASFTPVTSPMGRVWFYMHPGS